MPKIVWTQEISCQAYKPAQTYTTTLRIVETDDEDYILEARDGTDAMGSDVWVLAHRHPMLPTVEIAQHLTDWIGVESSVALLTKK
jgi:hypothetical protein